MTLEEVIINAKYQMADDGILDANNVCDRISASSTGSIFASQSRYVWKDDDEKLIKCLTDEFVQRFSVITNKIPVYYRCNVIGSGYDRTVKNIIVTIVASNGKKIQILQLCSMGQNRRVYET